MEFIILFIFIAIVTIVVYVAFKTYTLVVVEFIRRYLDHKGISGEIGSEKRHRQNILIYVIAAVLVFFAMKSCLNSDMMGEHEFYYDHNSGEYREVL